MKNIIKKSGIRDISEIKKRHSKAKIYFHQDLEGVTTAIAMKRYLENQGIKVVDCEIIQYGTKEFAIKKPEGDEDVMPVLVDFNHGKPMFVILTDHHDSQDGVEDDTATSFRHAQSNAETISQIISPKEIFTSDDIMLISMVDSAVNNITPEMIMNFLYKFDKDISLQKNKMLMGLVVKKLMLAYKNNPKFMETLVMDSEPSLLSILNNIKKLDKKYGYDDIETMTNIQESKEPTKKYYIDDSKIKGAGKGSFASKDIKKGDKIGLLHTIIKLGIDYKFTELGKMHNHNNKPNCHNQKIGNKRYLVASKNIKKGEELTSDYRLQPDLEQPEKNWGSIKENKEMRPEIDGYRTYSPFKNLEYIVVNGDGIDCNNIVYDLVLIGNNGKIKFCKKNSGIYFLKGATKVVEIPFKNNETYSEVFKSNETLNNWIKEKIKTIDTKKEILNIFLKKS